MNRAPILTDELLRQAITPDPSVTAPPGLIDAIMTEVGAMERRASPRPWWAAAGPAPRGRWTWAIIGAAALTALLVGILLAGAGGRPRPAIVEATPAIVEATFAMAGAGRLVGVSTDEALLATYDGALRIRTADGWSEPESIGASGIRGLARLPDGGVVVTGDTGSRVRDAAGGWTQLSTELSDGVAVAEDGTIWIAQFVPNARGLAAYRRTDAGWDRTWMACPAAGWRVLIARDGSVWTGGITYTGSFGLARVEGQTCRQVEPLGPGASLEVVGLAAGADGVVAVSITDYTDEQPMAGRILLFDGSEWSTIRDDQDSAAWAVGIGPDGAVYAASTNGVLRRDGNAWTTVVPGAHYMHLSITPDGTIWYIVEREDGWATVAHVDIDDLPR